MKTHFLAICLFALLPLRAFTGDESFSPSRQPLAVVRADSAATVARLLECRQLKALGLDKTNAAWTPPGLGVAIPSTQAALSAMLEANCVDLLYALTQRGATAAQKAGIIEFSSPAVPEDEAGAEAFLASLGMNRNSGMLEVRNAKGGSRRLSLYPDAAARREAFSGAARSDSPWRESLDAFLTEDRPGAGVWLNARPILGVLSLFTGFDARVFFNRYGLNAPPAFRLALFDTEGDLGISVLLDKLVPDFPAAVSQKSVPVPQVKDPIVEVVFPAFDRLWKAAKIKTTPFLLANLNIHALVPRSVALSVWRKETGETAWTAVAMLSSGENGAAQLRRVYAWLEYLAGVSSQTIGMESLETRGSVELKRIRLGDLSCVTGIARIAGHDGLATALILSGDASDWQDSFDLAAADPDALLSWRTSLDASSKQAATAALVEYAERFGKTGYSQEFFAAVLPESDSGHIRLDDGSVDILSRRGSLPLLLPGVADFFAPRIAHLREILSKAF